MRIAILSRNPSLYSTRSLVQAAQKRNHEVEVVDHMQCDLVVQDEFLEIYYLGRKLSNFQAIIPRIGNSATSHGSAVIRQFEAMNVFTTLGSDPLLKARDKLICLQLLAAKGIGVPRTVIPKNYYTMPSMIDRVGSEPFVIKLMKGTHGLGVILSESRKNAEAILETFFKTNQKAMLQEFIEEAGGADIRVFIVDDEIVGVMKRQAAAGEFRSNLHRGGSSTVDLLSEEEKLIAKKAARTMGLKVAGVDMLRSKRGPLILEVNASPGLEGIETTTKVDIAGKIITMIERNAKAEWRS